MNVTDDDFQRDLQRFFEVSLDMLCVAGTDGFFKRVSPSLSTTLGYQADELLERPFVEFVHADDREKTLVALDQLKSGLDVIQFENRYRHKDGTWRWLSWTCPAPEADGRLYAVGRDVTSQRNLGQELRIRDSILSSIQHGLLITDALGDDNPIIYCNPAFTELTAYSEEEIIGRNCRFLQGEDRDQVQLPTLREAMAAGEPCRVLLRNYKKDGTLFWNELTVSPVCDDSGRVTHFVGIQNDVSLHVRANEERWRDVASRLTSLAPRQRAVLDLLVAGKNTKTIARELGISAKTVETHRARIFAKMEVDSVVDLVRAILASRPWGPTE